MLPKTLILDGLGIIALGLYKKARRPGSSREHDGYQAHISFGEAQQYWSVDCLRF